MAIRWFRLVLLRSNRLDPKARKEFQDWLGSAENAKAYRRVEGLWIDADAIAARPEIVELRNAALAQTRQGSRRWMARAAASVAIVLTTVFLFSNSKTQSLVRDNLIALGLLESNQAEYASAVGEQTKVPLPDGGVVTLDTNSAARVAYSSRERAVTLLKGQAMFEVSKGERRPFTVYAHRQRVVATGTEFSVRLDQADVQVTLVEGQVVVDEQAAGEPVPVRRTVLRPGEQLTMKGDGKFSISNPNIYEATSWTSGRLVIRDKRLADAVAEINRYTETPIIIGDEGVADLRVNGVFRVGQPMNFAQAMSEIYPLMVESMADGTIRIGRKQDH